MTTLSEMDYAEFGTLKFLDFFPRTEAYKEDHEGGFESGIGLACTEGYLDTLFTSPVDQEWQTSEIILAFYSDCPDHEGTLLINRLGFQLRQGMSAAQVKETLGVPEIEQPRSLRFVVGKKWQYYVGCLIDDENGLCKVWICRKDLADEQIALES